MRAGRDHRAFIKKEQENPEEKLIACEKNDVKRVGAIVMKTVKAHVKPDSNASEG